MSVFCKCGEYFANNDKNVFWFLQFERLEQDSLISRRSRDLAGQELVVLVEGQPPYVQFGTL